MRCVIGIVAACLLCLCALHDSAHAGLNAGAQVSFSEATVRGDTLECDVFVTSAVKTRVVDLMFRPPEGVEFVSWEDGDFFSAPLRIGPTFHEPSRRLLVALAVRGKQLVTEPSGNLGTLTVQRTAPGDLPPTLLEAVLVDDGHHKDLAVAGDLPRQSPGHRETTPLPARLALHPASPNPAGPNTVVRFDIPEPGASVTITIYDVAGRVVRILTDGRRSAGYFSETWDLKNNRGLQVAPGLYFCRMEAGEFRDTRKIVVLR